MYWGQFITTKSREARDCLFCGESISSGVRHYGLVARKENARFTRHLHIQCYSPHIDAEEEKRLAGIVEERKNRPGRPGLGMSDEQKAKRKRVQEYIGDAKRELAEAYRYKKTKKAAKVKGRLLELIAEVETTGFPYWFRFGPNLLQELQTGADPSIPYMQALKADSEDKELGKRLLALTAETPQEEQPVDFHAAVEEAKALLAASLEAREYEQVREHMAALGHALLATPQKYEYRMGVDLNRQLGMMHAMMEFKYQQAEFPEAFKRGAHGLGDLFINISERKSQ